LIAKISDDLGTRSAPQSLRVAAYILPLRSTRIGSGKRAPHSPLPLLFKIRRRVGPLTFFRRTPTLVFSFLEPMAG
jgi:hypothetical protein